MKKQFQLIASLVSLIVVILVFQNCANGSRFSKVGDNSATDTGATDPTTTPIPVDAACNDSSGISHDSGSSWSTTASSVQPVTCLDANDSSQGYQTQDTFLCSNGTISQTGATSIQVPPTASCPAPVLIASLSMPYPQSGGATNLVVSATSVDSVSYSCTSVAHGNVTSAGKFACRQLNHGNHKYH